MNKTSNEQSGSVPLAAVALALASLATGIVFAGPGDGMPASWKAVAASGDVRSLDGRDATADWRRVSRGDRLEPQSQVRTGRRGRATLALGSSVILVDPGSQLQLPDGIREKGPARVVQRSGSAVYDIDGAKHGPVEIVTPYLIAGVKGTVFGVSVDDGYAVVSVEEGVVEVRASASGETLDLHAGEAAMIEASASARLEMPERREVRDGRGRTDEARRAARDSLKRAADVADERVRDDEGHRSDRSERAHHRGPRHGRTDENDETNQDGDGGNLLDEGKRSHDRELEEAEAKHEGLEEELRELEDDPGEDEPGLEDPLDPEEPAAPGDPVSEDREGDLPNPREDGGDGYDG